MRTVKLVVCGLGTVGRAFLGLLAERSGPIENEYALRFVCSAAVDIGGAAIVPRGDLPVRGLLSHLQEGYPVETLPEFGRPRVSGAAAIAEADADALIEVTPTNLIDGEPGKTHILRALERGMDVVSATKGPLVLFWRELNEAAAQNNGALHISAATAAALPTLDVGQVCLAGARLIEIEGILNGSTNYILTRMAGGDCAYAEALQEAQDLGIAETDPRLDVEGFDTANKLILIANRLFGACLGPHDVTVKGITAVTPETIAQAASAGDVIKLIGTARQAADGVKLSVVPKHVSKEHPLASVNGSEKAISYLTDTMDRITVMGGKSSPVGAAAALLKDLINAYR